MSTPLTMLFGALLAAASLTLIRAPQSAPPAPPDPDPAVTKLFIPVQADEGLECLPFMNRLHLGGCPMVIV